MVNEGNGSRSTVNKRNDKNKDVREDSDEKTSGDEDESINKNEDEQFSEDKQFSKDEDKNTNDEDGREGPCAGSGQKSNETSETNNVASTSDKFKTGSGQKSNETSETNNVGSTSDKSKTGSGQKSNETSETNNVGSTSDKSKSSPYGTDRIEGRRNLHRPKVSATPLEEKFFGGRIQTHELKGYPFFYKKKEEERKESYLCALCVCIVCILLYFYFTPGKAEKVPKALSFIDEAKSRFPSQPIRDFKIFELQIKRAKESKRQVDKSVVTTILHNGVYKMSKDLAEFMAEFALSEFDKENFYFIDGESITSDYNPCNLKCIKKEVSNNRVLIVNNFEKLPSSVAKHFHAVCDKYTPFVSDMAVYILVLNVPNMKVSKSNYEKGLEKQDLEMHARESMENLWPDLEVEYLQPLITRLIENLIWVSEDK